MRSNFKNKYQQGNYAYITSVGDAGGLQVVDLKRAEYPYARDEAIVGYLNMQSMEPHYGTPMDIAILKDHAYMTTIPGYFLSVDIGMPMSPNIIANIKPTANFQAWRVAVAGDYTDTDDAGNQQTSDIALVCPISGPLGQLNRMKSLDDVCEMWCA